MCPAVCCCFLAAVLLLLLQLHIMLDLKGHLKLCHPMEALASEQQRHIFRDEMIPGAVQCAACAAELSAVVLLWRYLSC
jgi:hypothetical protein